MKPKKPHPLDANTDFELFMGSLYWIIFAVLYMFLYHGISNSWRWLYLVFAVGALLFAGRGFQYLIKRRDRMKQIKKASKQ